MTFDDWEILMFSVLTLPYAKSIRGLLTRIAAKITAHSVGMMVNALLGRPVLKLAELAV